MESQNIDSKRKLQKQNRILRISLISFCIFTLLFVIGQNIPRLETTSPNIFRYYILFPTLIMLMLYMTTIHKWRGKATGYNMRMASLSGWSKFSESIQGLLGAVLISWFLSFSTGPIFAIVPAFLSKERTEIVLVITKISPVESMYAKRYTLDLFDPNTFKQYFAFLPRRYYSQSKPGDTLYIKGKMDILVLL